MTEHAARQAARDLQAQYDLGEWDPWASDAPTTGETLSTYAARWLEDRRKRGLRSVTADDSRLRHWLLPTLGHKPIADVTRADVEGVRDMLDAQVRMASIAWKTAQNIWLVVGKLFADACNAKTRALRVLTANPCTGILPPDRGRERARTYLHPSELLALVACEAVDLAFRRLVAVAVYTYAREGELAALEWSDVDATHGTISVHRARDGKTGEVRTPKTQAGTRTVPIEPTLRPLLVAMGNEAGWSGRVFDRFPAQRDASRWLREGLLAAG